MSSVLMGTDRMRTLSGNGSETAKYGISLNAPISMQHLYAMKLYTDCSWLCKIFCEAFRMKKVSETEYERIESVQRRNEKIANWAALLMETVQCYGELRAGKRSYFRGIDAEFVFKRFVSRFDAPLSTTTEVRP